MAIKLSNDQKGVLDSLLEWYKDNRGRSSYLTLGGYAGTGKTTLISVLRKKLHRENKKLRIAFVSYTGKAARILKTKLKETKVNFKQDFVGTIHSLIYSPIENEKQEIIGWKLRDKVGADLLIIDEASMVNQSIWKDLRSFGLPIIAVGDHGQLPPIQGFFNLMDKPMLRLEEIHRQAKNNPIIRLSIIARETGVIPFGTYQDNIIKLNRLDYDTGSLIDEMLAGYNNDTLILCGYNTTRKKLNGFIRKALGFVSPDPQSGDRVICLRNNHEKGIFNGMIGTILTIEKENEEWYSTRIAMDQDEEEYKGLISSFQFNADSPLNFTGDRYKIMRGDLFDFGYALTVHKAQGSQAKRVVLFEERFRKMDDNAWKRWLYTAVTRAEEELIIIA